MFRELVILHTESS